MGQLHNDATLLQMLIAQKATLLVDADNGYNLESFKNEPALIQRAIIYYLLEHAACGTVPSQALINEILRFLTSPRGGSHAISPRWIVEKKSKRFLFSKIG